MNFFMQTVTCNLKNSEISWNYQVKRQTNAQIAKYNKKQDEVKKKQDNRNLQPKIRIRIVPIKAGQ